MMLGRPYERAAAGETCTGRVAQLSDAQSLRRACAVACWGLVAHS